MTGTKNQLNQDGINRMPYHVLYGVVILVVMCLAGCSTAGTCQTTGAGSGYATVTFEGPDGPETVELLAHPDDPFPDALRSYELGPQLRLLSYWGLNNGNMSPVSDLWVVQWRTGVTVVAILQNGQKVTVPAKILRVEIQLACSN